MKRQKQEQIDRSLQRQRWMQSVMLLGAAVLMGKLLMLETVGNERLRKEADARHLRTVDIHPVRGAIEDRNGHLLAVSTPVDSLWAEPKVFCQQQENWPAVAKALRVKTQSLKKSCAQQAEKPSRFMYLKRQQSPAVAKAVLELDVPGVHSQREYKRFYPTGPASAHMVGFTDIDNHGQEGLEKALDTRLVGGMGEKTVHRDSKGRFVEFVEQTREVKNGELVRLSLDSRLQYLASAYLEAAVREHQASSGSVVMIKVPSGEILAIADSPQFNPNDRRSLKPEKFRNRAFTDVQEPGSTVKPFTVAMALESGRYTVGTRVETGKKPLKIRGGTISDTKRHGTITLAEVVKVSSNIGAAKVAMDFPPKRLFDTLGALGFGQKNQLGVAESAGMLPLREKPIDHATQSFGYGLSATTLQLARAYTALATDGRLLPLTFTAAGRESKGERVFSADTARALRRMLESVTGEGGTARKAQVARYRVGGKTGTTHKLIDGKYADDRYVSSFVGMAPITRPEFVLAVVIDDPRGEKYFGGSVAAPVFSRLMADALRLYNVAPDGDFQLAPETRVVKGAAAQGGGA